MPTTQALPLRRIRISRRRASGDDDTRLPFLKGGPVDIKLQSPLTLLVGENGSGKTTLLEAIAARCAIPPFGGESYREVDDDRPETAASQAVKLEFSCHRPPGWFMRADRLHVATAREDPLRMGHRTEEWRRLDEQSRGASMLSLLTAEIDRGNSELFLLDEPDTGLSPKRQIALLRLLDEIGRQSRSQAIVATHSVVLMAHPEADLPWLDDTGIFRRPRDDLPHWSVMSDLMRDPRRFLRSVLDD
jgi:predicted ATPase